MIMTIGQRLRRAMEKAGMTQKEVAERAGLQADTVGDIMHDRSNPRHTTVEVMVTAIGTTWADMYDEPQISLSQEDVETGWKAVALFERVLNADADLKEQRAAAATRKQQPHDPPRRKGDEIRDAPLVRHPADEVADLPGYKIPQAYVREGARRAMRVVTDGMIEAGILQGDIVHLRPSINVEAADGQIIVCTLNGVRLLKKLDTRSGKITLQSANPKYDDIVINDADAFTMTGVVIMSTR